MKLMFPADSTLGAPASMIYNCRCTMVYVDELDELLDQGMRRAIDRETGESVLVPWMSYKEWGKQKMIYNNSQIGVVKAGKIEANGRFVNSNEKLYRYAKKVIPIDGFTDFTCHADADRFYIDMVGNENKNDHIELSVKEFAQAISNSKSFNGTDIRIISCQAGAKENGAAQKLADELRVAVYAPTEIVNIDENGEMFVSDNDILAEVWYNPTKDERTKIKETGEWVLFEPRKR